MAAFSSPARRSRLTTTTTRVLLAALAGAAAILPARDAAATSASASDCNLGFTSSYNPGDAVCITGQINTVPPGKICGEGYAIVTPTGNADPFVDVTAGGANYIMACAGAGEFYDEYVWLPPLKPGSYELVLDAYPFFGAFGPEDWRDGQTSFTVSNAPVVFTVDVAAIKAAAKNGLATVAGLRALAFTLNAIDALGTAADWAISFGTGGGLAGLALGLYCYTTNSNCPTSYDSAIITIGNKIIGGVADSLELKYSSIIADPPDPNFAAVVPLQMKDAVALGAPWTPHAASPIVERQVAIGQLLATQSAAYEALVPTLEKLQGAKLAGSNEGLLIHAEKAKAYTQLALDSGDAMLTTLDALEADLKSQGKLTISVDPVKLKADVASVAQGGLDAADTATLQSFGLSAADIAGVEMQIKALQVPDKLDAATLIQDARDTFNAMRPALVDLAAQVEKVRVENEPVAFRTAPQAMLMVPASGSVGVALPIAATAIYFDPKAALTFSWDTDLDGTYNDGSGPNLMFTPKAPGRTTIGVKVTDPNGKSDYAYATIDVAISNHPPELTLVTPTDPAPFADVNEKVPFHAEAKDSDGDALTFTWRVDGMDKGTGADFDFTMPDQEPHRVEVVVADTDMYSPDANQLFVVRSSKWKTPATSSVGAGGSSATGATGTGTGMETGTGTSSATATGAGGGTGGGSSGGNAGCACDVAGATSTGIGLGPLALAALALLRRRRSRRA